MCLNLSPLMVSYKPQGGPEEDTSWRLRVWRVDKSTSRPCSFNGQKKGDEHAV
jgi:hypothetical protein